MRSRSLTGSCNWICSWSLMTWVWWPQQLVTTPLSHQAHPHLPACRSAIQHSLRSNLAQFFFVDFAGLVQISILPEHKRRSLDPCWHVHQVEGFASTRRNSRWQARCRSRSRRPLHAVKSSSMSIPRISYLKRRGIVGGRRPPPEGHLRPAIIGHHRAGWGRHGFFGLGLP